MTGWTLNEKNLVATAAAAAPSVHNTQPWVLEFHEDHEVRLYERLDRPLPHHDPLGRDRLISCGAALEHVRLAMRILGWLPQIALRHDGARVTTTGRAEPSTVDRRRHGAIVARHSHRRPFAARPVAAALRAELLTAHHTDGVGVRRLYDDETPALARLLHHAALALRADDAYQRELAAWTAPVRDPLPGAGVSSAIRRTSTLPWGGLVRRTTMVPDVPTLTGRLRGELILLLETPDDGPFDHVRAGTAAEQIWLAAVDTGLAGALSTQPFQLHEVRAGLVEALSLSGFPQLMLRFGHQV
ncbi:Acg family FMN-binding oxidoreductase [Actinophytocola sp.]|uniref:Acg family FMN-binding oxidoreductase n=1 Tax=Actinophytocola sp. TaxID=1872138 RepID=UPI002ED5A2B6